MQLEGNCGECSSFFSKTTLIIYSQNGLGGKADSWKATIHGSRNGGHTEKRDMGKCVLPKEKKSWMHVGFTIKCKADGTIERDKARRVAKWHAQTYGIDYLETFSYLAKIDIIMVLGRIFVTLGGRSIILTKFCGMCVVSEKFGDWIVFLKTEWQGFNPTPLLPSLFSALPFSLGAPPLLCAPLFLWAKWKSHRWNLRRHHLWWPSGGGMCSSFFLFMVVSIQAPRWFTRASTMPELFVWKKFMLEFH